MPGVARSEFFSGNPWYMHSDCWVNVGGGDPIGVTSELVDTPGNDRLEWIVTSTGWTGAGDDDDVFRAKASLWQFDLSTDFEFSVDFHYDHEGTYATDAAGVMMGLYYFEGEEDEPYTAEVGAENWVSDWHGTGLENKNVGWWGLDLSDSSEVDGWWRRDSNDGVLRISYNSSEDRLQLDALDRVDEVLEQIGSTNHFGLSDDLGVNYVGVFLGGWSEGAALASGDAYLENFQASGTITPEPVSSVLYVIGGASLAFFRYRRKSRRK